MSKDFLDSIWGNEIGTMLTVCKTKGEPGVELSIGFPPNDIQGHVTLTSYRVKRLIEVLQKVIAEDYPNDR